MLDDVVRRQSDEMVKFNANIEAGLIQKIERFIEECEMHPTYNPSLRVGPYKAEDITRLEIAKIYSALKDKEGEIDDAEDA